MSIGEALAAARYRAGLTVTQVSQRTRIRETVIRDIENDDYSMCGGDFYARGHIRNIARVVGADPQPLIRAYDTAPREYGTAHQGPRAMGLDDMFTGTPATLDAPIAPARVRDRRRLATAAALGLALLVALGFIAYGFLPGSPHADSAAPLARTHHVTGHHARPNRPATAHPARPAAPPRTPAPVSEPRTLIPVRAAAFGPPGAGRGDNPRLAPFAIDHSRTTAWHSDSYTSARFGNLYRGTGLLLDMGRPVTITGARIILGSAPGARLRLRVGMAPTLAGLRPVAHAASTGAVMWLRLTTPAHGRYVLIWFTGLPPDRRGGFRVIVHDVRLEAIP